MENAEEEGAAAVSATASFGEITGTRLIGDPMRPHRPHFCEPKFAPRTMLQFDSGTVIKCFVVLFSAAFKISFNFTILWTTFDNIIDVISREHTIFEDGCSYSSTLSHQRSTSRFPYK
ncbi:hypothetical protein Y032_0522g2900 [Ancylostoma ceylanicum]|uniref:Uncharacterized protein n=1 Tax=Ancylostoma ceylanicum TaxID=53326 RepID=A0A016WTU7_9BILA|nr:hypothetical protein Y032_0522g2900 [Ancylostoma ceylanicum]